MKLTQSVINTFVEVKLKGSEILTSQVNSEIPLELSSGSTISATIYMNKDVILLAKGDEAWVVFQESSVILAII